jgi:hypothetical protein
MDVATCPGAKNSRVAELFRSGDSSGSVEDIAMKSEQPACQPYETRRFSDLLPYLRETGEPQPDYADGILLGFAVRRSYSAAQERRSPARIDK